MSVKLPWIRSPSQLIADKVSSSVTRCYNTFMVQTIFTTWAAFRSVHKDVLLIFQQSNLIYKFHCCYNATSQRLEVRVKQHVPRDIRNHTTSGHSKLFDSAISEHLNALNSCAVNYNDECFGVFIEPGQNKIWLYWKPFTFYFTGQLYSSKAPSTPWTYCKIIFTWLRTVFNFFPLFPVGLTIIHLTF